MDSIDITAGRRRVRPSFVVLAAASVAALVLSACGSSGSSSDAGGKSDYLIGFEGSLSGANAPTGTSILKGLTIAINDVNSTGGVNGHKLKIVSEDDAGDTAKAIAAVRTIATQKVLLMTGGNLSAIVDAILPAVTQSGLSLVAQGAGPGVLDPVQKNSFQIDLTSSANAQPMVEFAAALLGKTSFKAAIGPVNTPSGQAWGKSVETLASQKGITITAKSPVPVTATDMTTTAQKLLTGSPDIVLVQGPDPVLPPLVAKIRSLGYSGPIVNFSYGSATKTLQTIADPKLYVARSMAQYDPTSTAAGTKQFVKLVDAAGEATNAQSATQYSQGYLLGLAAIGAIKACGDTCTASAVTDALGTLHVDTDGFTAKPLTFTATDHVANKSVVFYAWDGSKPAVALDGKSFAGSVYSLDATN